MLLSDVIDCHGPDGGEIDFLKIDVEGWEAGVIASGDWTRHRPRVLVIEAVDDKGNLTYEAWDPDLLGAGYRFAMFDGLNRFYCREEDAGLGALANENATAEARMASLEMDLSRREAADPSRRARNPFEGIFFRPDGRPVKPLRRLLFQTSGAPRRFLRALVLHKNGTPRSAFAHWMGTAKYLGLPNAVKRPGHQVTKRDDVARHLDPRDELAITTKVKTPEPDWSVTGPAKSVSSVGDATAQPRDRAIASAVERRRLGVSVRSSHRKRLAYSPLPDATPDKDQVI